MSHEHLPPSHSRCGELSSHYYESDRVEVQPLVKCCHCGYIWVWRPPNSGGGHLRGFCQTCNGLVCGHAACVMAGCVSEEQHLENCEAGLGWWSSHKPIRISVPCKVPA